MSGASKTSLLFELGTEELPAGPLQTMALALRDGIAEGLSNQALVFGQINWFATPRRLAVLVTELDAVAPDSTEQVLGPPVQSAKNANGHWSPAAIGFAKKQGVDPDALESVDTDKGPRLGINRVVTGARAAEVVADVIALAVANIPVAKRMHWGRGKSEFLRPVQWLVALLDDSVVELSLFELSSDRITYGHRFHAPDPVVIANAQDYPQVMRDNWVIANFDERRELIEQQVNSVAQEVGAKAVISEDLLDEVTGLVEWPVALRGSFDEAFLQVPAEALISSMREHQKYFHLLDRDQQLLPMFITVSNIESRNPATVIEGNEKVIRPRLSDAAFFFETDKKTPLEQRITRLDGVVFQQKLGTLGDKVQRMVKLSSWLADAMCADAALSERAALLSKCDLVSEMVLEFPELQGTAGAHYARNDGESEAVASAIEQHYWPRFAGDALPESAEGAAVALADRLDTMVGIFGIGQTPTGSKDPFALRRAAVGIVRILIERRVGIGLAALCDHAVQGYAQDVLEAGAAQTVSDYIIDRLRAWYEDQGISVGVLRSVIATGIDVPSEIDQRVKALAEFASTDEALALAAANKRVANILAKSNVTLDGEINTALLTEGAEQGLFAALQQSATALKPLQASADYSSALKVLATLRGAVDTFFEHVMVNADDAAQRHNRYLLLKELRQQFVSVADIAHL